MPRLSLPLTALAMTATLTSAVKVGGPEVLFATFEDLNDVVTAKQLVCALCLRAETKP